jgi:hypothetical protein
MKMYWHTTNFVPNPHLGEVTGWLIQEARWEQPSRQSAGNHLTGRLVQPPATRVIPARWFDGRGDEDAGWITSEGGLDQRCWAEPLRERYL